MTLGVIRGHRQLDFTITHGLREAVTQLVWQGDDARAARLSNWFDQPFTLKAGQEIPLTFYENFHGIEMVL